MKRILFWLFLFFFTLSILSLFTPLTINYFWLSNCIYFFTVFLSFFATSAITNKVVKALIKFVPISMLLFIIFSSFIFTPMGNKFTSGWQTTSILYRQIKQPDVYIAQQMLNVGGLGYKKRMVKVIPLFPFTSWVTIADTIGLNKRWKKVNEELNPFNLK